MSFAQRSLSLAGIIGILTAVFAGGLIYLLVTQPVATAENIANGEVSPLVRAVAGALFDALRGVLSTCKTRDSGSGIGIRDGPPFNRRTRTDARDFRLKAEATVTKLRRSFRL